jgi:hypothetical protein
MVCTTHKNGKRLVVYYCFAHQNAQSKSTKWGRPTIAKLVNKTPITQ